MIPIRELRHIIESSFAPMVCRCDINPDGTLTVEVSDPVTGHADLVVGVPLRELTTVRALNDLVAGMRANIKANREWFGRNTHPPHISKIKNS